MASCNSAGERRSTEVSFAGISSQDPGVGLIPSKSHGPHPRLLDCLENKKTPSSSSISGISEVCALCQDDIEACVPLGLWGRDEDG